MTKRPCASSSLRTAGEKSSAIWTSSGSPRQAFDPASGGGWFVTSWFNGHPCGWGGPDTNPAASVIIRYESDGTGDEEIPFGQSTSPRPPACGQGRRRL